MTACEYIDHLESRTNPQPTTPSVVQDAIRSYWLERNESPPDNLDGIFRGEAPTVSLFYNDLIKLMNKEKAPAFVSLFLSDFNAFAVRSPGSGDPVIVYSSNLEYVVNALSHGLVRLTFEELLPEELTSIAQKLVRAVAHFLSPTDQEIDRPSVIELTSLEPHLCNVGHTLSVTINTFILAHELGHHMLGHTGETRQITHPLPNDQQLDWLYYVRMQTEEFEADQFAAEMLEKVTSATDECVGAKTSVDYLHAPHVFFEILDFAYAMLELDSGCQVTHDTHPAPKARREMIVLPSHETAQNLAASLINTLDDLKQFAIGQIEQKTTPD